jgi:hypothetical protein
MARSGPQKSPEEASKKKPQAGLSPLARVLIGVLYAAVLGGGILLIYYLSTSGRF